MVRLLYLLLLLSLVAAPLSAQTTKPIPGVDRVLIFSIDGCRPDVMLRADTPNIRSLMKHGSYSMWAFTAPVAITLPSHTSMLTGTTVERHGIDFNDERATTQPSLMPKTLSIFDVAKQAGYTTALVSGKVKFIIFSRRNNIDWQWLPEGAKTEDHYVTENAVKIIHEHQPQVMFVHYPGADNVGHAIGWGSHEQVAAIEGIDHGIGEVVKALEDDHLLEHTLIILSADHGGSGRVHGQKVPDSANIPWIASAPTIRQDYDLTLISNMRINTYDTFATACWAMGIPLASDSDGKPITQILPGQELIVAEPKGAGTAAISRGVK